MKAEWLRKEAVQPVLKLGHSYNLKRVLNLVSFEKLMAAVA